MRQRIGIKHIGSVLQDWLVEFESFRSERRVEVYADTIDSAMLENLISDMLPHVLEAKPEHFYSDDDERRPEPTWAVFLTVGGVRFKARAVKLTMAINPARRVDVVLTPEQMKPVREGWAEASKRIAASGDVPARSTLAELIAKCDPDAPVPPDVKDLL